MSAVQKLPQTRVSYKEVGQAMQGFKAVGPLENSCFKSNLDFFFFVCTCVFSPSNLFTLSKSTTEHCEYILGGRRGRIEVNLISCILLLPFSRSEGQCTWIIYMQETFLYNSMPLLPFAFCCLSSRVTLFSWWSSFSWAQDEQTFSKLILKGNYQAEILWAAAIKGF